MVSIFAATLEDKCLKIIVAFNNSRWDIFHEH
jgi:hypothetical protein